MGRPSKLTPKQWAEVERRMLNGEKADALGKEFKISGSSIRDRFSALHGKVKSVAGQLVSAEYALRELPVSAQLSALSLADDMRAISMHMAGAARFGAATAHRLSGIAHGKVVEIDDAAPLDDDSFIVLKGISTLTRMANDAAVIPSNLLAANKDAFRPSGDSDKTELLKRLAGGLPD